ncbi:hypothetical protein [Archaeoglobus veneficus]|uniref:DUF8060 domain-containing protein n=1 Tax=Archaeoglobus veneficus (strain DSM 11195 / SNP6) TaxID=693661 RepID=F2KRC7_ARCVS|nr:hypothetical protein [Archaeoglobus veneficus]AEA47861.1 hypothetical protein Arcve_1868 [Archaeoglobus veneficus SNP6]
MDEEEKTVERNVKEFDFEDILRKVLIAFVVIMLAVATWGLYTSLNDLIRIWIGYKYAPLYRALLNLAVLAIAIYLLNLLVRGRREKQR